jgi:LPS-assembly protein
VGHSRFFVLFLLITTGLAAPLAAAPARAAAPRDVAAVLPTAGTRVDLTADTLTHDDAAQMVTAAGNVEFLYDGRTLRADQVDYNLSTEIVTARGGVTITDPAGDIHRADELRLTRDMADGYVRALHTTLADGSRFTARTGQRLGGRQIIMRDATYTPCLPCKTDPTRPPLWQLRADRVAHDNQKKEISYQDARFELAGVPLFYLPYFSHPDGSIKQKNGFLTPIFKLDSQNGANIATRYYWGLDPWRDATLGVQVFTKQAPRLTGEYRQRFDNADLKTSGSFTYSERRDRIGTETVVRDEKLRGHIDTQARWDMTDKWRSGVNLKLASDEQYLRQYKITGADVLDNELYAEWFDNRDYTVIRALAFQDLRTSTRRTDQPNILPDAQASFYGRPGDWFGGRWRVQASALGLERSDDGDDMTRASTSLSWERQDTTAFGLVTTLDTSVRADLYHAINHAAASTTEEDKTRLFPTAHLTARWPLAKPVATGTVIVEPIAALTLVPRLNERNRNVPNEDSQDIQLDASNLFEPSRFPGLDRVEDLSRVTYGTRVSHMGGDSSMIEGFLGQSYRFDDIATTTFPENSGLSRQQSDIVGRIKYQAPEFLALEYAVQLDGHDFGSVRHEFDQRFSFDPFTLNTRYLYAKTIDGVGVAESREQAQVYSSYKFDPDWQIRAGANYDLGSDPGLRKGLLGLDYLGQCLTFSATVERNLTNETSGESGAELMLRLGLKNLGEFATSGIGLSSSNEDNDIDMSRRGLPVGD